MKTAKRITTLLLAFVMIFASISNLASCSNGNGKDFVVDNEETRLVIATSELDGVFNPFYSSSAPDGSIVSMTQISMLSADKDGKVAYAIDSSFLGIDGSVECIRAFLEASEK